MTQKSPLAAPESTGATPAMAQWFELKARNPDALLFFRMGDFYEMFFADAEAAATALDIALTHRGEHGGRPIAMCGVPVHAAEAYLARLIRRGFRVAVGEQMEDPKTRMGKAPIRRDVVRLVTPGTLTEDSLLESARPNLLAGLVASGGPGDRRIGAAWLDISTGLFETQDLSRAGLPALLGRLDPAEILAAGEIDLGDFAPRCGTEACAQPSAQARRVLAEAFGAASLDAFGQFADAEAQAAAMLLDYVRLTQAGQLPRLSRPLPQGEAGRLELDAATRASLEITRARDGSTSHTLLASVQRTLTAPGARLLAAWLAAPLTDAAAIGARQEGWGHLLAAPDLAAPVRAALRGVPDMARALGRLSLGRGTPRDLAAIRAGLAAAAELREMLNPLSASRGAAGGEKLPRFLLEIRADLDVPPALHERLEAALADPAPARLEEGAIAAGFDGELDAHRALRDDSRRVIAALQLDFAQRFGVASLKIKHHAQLGYVIEAPAVAVEKLRDNPLLTLRQGMANGARFTTPELSDLDRRITEAADRAWARERAIFAALVAETLEYADPLARCADALARLDVAQSAAALAAPGTWSRPDLTEGADFAIAAGRHPVVEAAIAGQAAFVPNDCGLPPEGRVLLLTGPNMAGKSTFLRQNALIVILAQAGLPVPAASARIGIVDRLFSRVGAADDLARGRSTFMVEMTETASILHQAGPRSLVVVDEIGRGTATLDGLAIAWAVLEALHNTVRCRTIFATHFHELSQLSGELPNLAPHAMRVKDWRGEVVFLHEVARGAAGRSWGVHVAKLAGVPAPVVRRAGQLLAALETRAGRLTDAASLPLFATAEPARPESAAPDPLHAALEALDPDQMSPRDALAALYALRTLLTDPGSA
jgi:DNA mismatch repair protein MutS